MSYGTDNTQEVKARTTACIPIGVKLTSVETFLQYQFIKACLILEHSKETDNFN